jgi:DNA-directed RNA polymerase subunit RPC12/RpoP
VAERAEKPKRNWIQEERRTILGHWVAFCVACGHTTRYFEEFESELPSACPHCAGQVKHLCSSCGARFPSAFQVRCEDCEAEIRPAELFGGPIRKPGR